MTLTQPFENDAEYLEAEFAWTAAHCRYIGARQIAENEARDRDGDVENEEEAKADSHDEARQKITHLAAIATTHRESIDRRLETTRAGGCVLGIDRLCDEHHLDSLERQVLLLTTMPAVGLELYEVLGSVGSFGFSVMAITPALVATFTELPLTDTLNLRQQFGVEGRLIKSGLVEVDLPCGERCQDFPLASLYVTQAAFDFIVGIATDAAQSRCPVCGQPHEQHDF